LLRGFDEHVLHEQSLVALCAESSHFQSIFGIPASIAINNYTVSLMVKVLNSKLLGQIEWIFVHRGVVLAPVDSGGGFIVLHDSQVLRLLSLFLLRICAQGSIWAYIQCLSIILLGLLLFRHCHLIKLRHTWIKF
jgi:hypothetical protein